MPKIAGAAPRRPKARSRRHRTERKDRERAREIGEHEVAIRAAPASAVWATVRSSSTGMAKLNANSERPRTAAASNAPSRAASQPISTMPKIGAMIWTMAVMRRTNRQEGGTAQLAAAIGLL